jgi:cysteine desulfurase/selenocysteine lyase
MDIKSVRQDTKACEDKIFLNSAGSSLVPGVVLKTMVSYLEQEALTGGYALARSYENEVKEFYAEVATLLNCKAENIAFSGSATDAYSKAISAITFEAGDTILTTNDDYISNQLAFLSLKNRFGIDIIKASNLPDGDLDLPEFEWLVAEKKPKLVALTHIPTNSGLVQQAREVGDICKKYGAWYLLDACQSVGQMVVDVQQIGCDFLTATGRKFLRGPRGTGFLYVADRVLEKGLAPLIFDMQGAKWTGTDTFELAETAKRFEFWEFSYAGILGLAAAVKYINTIGIRDIAAYNEDLMRTFRKELAKVKGLRLHDQGTRLSNILTFTIDGKSIEEIEENLKRHQVYYSISYKDFTLPGLTGKNAGQVIRLSPHYFNTAEELEKVADILRF